MKLVFCTNNQHKLQEVAQLIGGQIDYLTLQDIHYTKDIPEPYETLEENSFTKANQVYLESNENCFAEDTGLFIEALNGAPGVYSARYAGEPSDANKNMEKVLYQMQDVANRQAYFKTVITLILDGVTHQFEGICEGNIATSKSGAKGFGYDPIFIPIGSSKSFAEHTAEEKNALSHRRKAFEQMASFLMSIHNQ